MKLNLKFAVVLTYAVIAMCAVKAQVTFTPIGTGFVWTAGGIIYNGPYFTQISNSSSGGGGGELPVSGAIVWLDATDSSTMFTNTAGTVLAVGDSSQKYVAKWQDKSTPGTNSVYMDIPALNERRPALSNQIAELNNLPGLVFGCKDITGEERTWLQTPTNNVLLGATGMTAFVVGSKVTYTGESGDNFPMLIAHGAAGAQSWESRVEGATGGSTTNFDSIINGATLTTAQGFRIGRGYCWTLRGDNRDTGNWNQWRNGVPSTAINLAADMFPKANGLSIGSRWMSAARDNCWHGVISTVIIYPWSLSDLQVSNVNYYCTNKYKLHDP